MRKKRKGFTLIEILTVVLIIGMLGAFVAPRLFKGLGKAKTQIAVGKMAILENALGQFYFHCGRFPNDAEGLEALIIMPDDLEGKWNGRYCKQSDLLDPWGNPFMYYEGSGELGDKEYELISFGADGLEGGEGDNADITND
ncbi:MAG: type II secretion system major pseudopilin GspG [Phycisphaerae bacterium]|nr:type II secretion system major pseudopilin GspG [Phycisphaerae bacterium]